MLFNTYFFIIYSGATIVETLEIISLLNVLMALCQNGVTAASLQSISSQIVHWETRQFQYHATAQEMETEAEMDWAHISILNLHFVI